MKVQLKHMGVVFIRLDNIDPKYLMAIKHIQGESAVFQHYAIINSHGAQLSHLDQDKVEDGEYDLPLTDMDFLEYGCMGSAVTRGGK